MNNILLCKAKIKIIKIKIKTVESVVVINHIRNQIHSLQPMYQTKYLKKIRRLIMEKKHQISILNHKSMKNQKIWLNLREI